MALSLVLLAGALSILYSSKVTNTENERIARLQEAGRTVVELVLRDTRGAGFMGCARPLETGDFTNELTNPTTLLWQVDRPAVGFEANGSGWLPAPLPVEIADPDPSEGSDILVLRSTREGLPVFRLNAPVITQTDALQVTRPSNAAMPAGSVMIVGDCSGATAFTVTAFTGNTPTTATISHAAGAATADAGSAGNVSGSLQRSFRMGALVTPIDTIIYYVAEGAAGEGPSLWRRIGNAAPVELIEGVENLQILYGVDTDVDLLADDYMRADEVAAANRWDSVISLTISILVRSQNETNIDRDERTYTLISAGDGAVLGPFNDRRQRSVFTTTVMLRNRTT